MCKNAAATIAATIKSVQCLSNDIVLYDTGSMDDTLAIAKQYPVKVYTGPWEGYGISRGKTVNKATHNWVLVIDSDEVATKALVRELAQINWQDVQVAYRIRLQNFIGDKEVRWGVFYNDYRIRLFNKQHVQWNEAIIHEKLIFKNIRLKKLRGCIKHYNAGCLKTYTEKWLAYAPITAQKYVAVGRRATWVRRFTGPLYTFIKIYVFTLGFLDGYYGWATARLFARYTFLKYACLFQLQKAAGQKR